MLPPTMREMHHGYKIVGAPGSFPSARVAMVTPERPQVQLIADLILAVLSAIEFDHYLVFKLFEMFPEVRLSGCGLGCG